MAESLNHMTILDVKPCSKKTDRCSGLNPHFSGGMLIGVRN